MYKKALASGLIAILIIMFIFGLSSLLALKGWTTFNNSIQNMDNNTIHPATKEKIDAFTTKINWADKLFIMFFIALLIMYLISSVTIPTEQPIFALLFFGILIVITIFAMVLSNTWDFIGSLDILSSEAQSLKFTDYFMSLYPYIALFIGLIGGIIFYSRKSDEGGGVPFGE